jgi:rare lipoprotein A
MMRRYFMIGLIAIAAVASFHSAVAHVRQGLAHAGRFNAGHARHVPEPAVAVTEPSGETLWAGERGTASYYGPKQDGRLSASGVRFDQRLLTAAHPWLPFGTRIRVTMGETGRSVIVTITDRLYSTRRIVDLSLAAARELGMIRSGIAEVTLDPL